MSKKAFECWEKGGEMIKVKLDPEDHLVCNLRDALKEKKKPRYDDIAADEILVFKKGDEATPLRGDTELEDGKSYLFQKPRGEALQTSSQLFFKVSGTILNVRGVAGLRKQIVHEARIRAGRGSIDSNEKDVDVCLFFEKASEAMQFQEAVKQVVDSHKGLVILNALVFDSTPVILPKDTKFVPEYQKADASIDEDATSGSPSSTTTISKLPAESPNIAKHTKYAEVVHLVPKCLLPKSQQNTKPCPWLVIGGSPQLNRMTDEKIPTVRFSTRVFPGQEKDDETAKLSKDECRAGCLKFALILSCGSDLESFQALTATTRYDRQVDEKSIEVDMCYKKSLFPQFESVLKWRSESIVEAEHVEEKGMLGSTNKSSVHSAWYQLVPLPDGIVPVEVECDQ